MTKIQSQSTKTIMVIGMYLKKKNLENFRVLY
jgi:hypothetical protein